MPRPGQGEETDLTISHATTAATWRQHLSGILRGHRFLDFVPFLGYLAAQGFIVAGLPTPLFPDSPGYTQLSFTGQDPRLWTVPLLYTILTSDALRIAAQVVLAAMSWWILARVASDRVRDTRVRLGLRLILLALGLVGPIASWNSTILSDSAAVSLTALLVACWICHQSHPTWKTALSVVVVTLFWSCTRNDLVVDGAIITAIAVVVTVFRHRDLINIVLAIGLIAVSAYGLAIDGRNPYVANANVADVIEQRILYNPSWTNWFVDHGMPYSSAVAASKGGIYGEALMAIPSVNSWLTTNGLSTYTEFILEHPVYALWYTLPYFSGEEASLNETNHSPYIAVQPNPTPSLLSPDANYGRHRDILPTVIEELLFQQGQIGDVMTLAFFSFGLVFVARRRLGRDPRMWVPLIVTFSAIPQGYLVWLYGGNAEIDRHALLVAVSVRIGLWMVGAFALDRLLTQRRLTSAKSNGGLAQSRST